MLRQALKENRRLIDILISLIALTSFFVYLWSFRGDLPHLSLDSRFFLTLSTSVLFYGLATSVGGVIWAVLIRDHGHTPPLISLIIICAVAQFGKYLPGNIGHHLGRVILAKRIGIPAVTTVSTMMVEVMWAVSTGCCLVLITGLLYLDLDAFKSVLSLGHIELVFIAVVLLILPWAAVHFVNAAFPHLIKRFSKQSQLPIPKASSAIVVSLLFLGAFFTSGVILKVQTESIFQATNTSLIELTGLFCIAWLAGFLVPGAPAGLGIRESLMVVLLAPMLGHGAAFGLAITFRITTTIGDALAFGLGVLGYRKFVARLEIK